MNLISATSMADVVAIAVNGIGFVPTSSVALLLTNEAGLIATLRADASPEAPADQWAQALTNYVHRVTDANGVILISFEDEQAMTAAQYRALGDTLAHAGCPIRSAILVTGGHLMDYDGDSTDSVKSSTVATSNAALALMMATTQSAKLAADIPACTNPANEALARFTREALTMDCTDEETLTVARGTLADMIEGYRHSGIISAEHAAWIAGTFTTKGMCDMLMASLATPSYDTGTVGAVMLGRKSPEGWKFFKAGADALYAALEFIPTEHRADLLAGIGGSPLSTVRPIC
ncbi:DUF4192 family protein [Arthrobacter sp. MYb213]|uniref:DUF4192 family protein n=1 Tax=Arthrobacter sp. MYb213 TaxID=1848595 RepID=UPI000CFD48CB|nr:DUF4192 family protein [Arthrobacter sp. MYb213]PRB71347.1 hypothetical protein CQ011_05440 [Arthrobacter sp. MYb213]